MSHIGLRHDGAAGGAQHQGREDARQLLSLPPRARLVEAVVVQQLRGRGQGKTFENLRHLSADRCTCQGWFHAATLSSAEQLI